MIIDTGLDTGPSFGFDPDAIMTAVMDSLPPDPPQHDIDRRLFVLIRQMLNKPIRRETVRKTFMANWHLIQPLANRDPAIFDQIIEEFHSALSERA